MSELSTLVAEREWKAAAGFADFLRPRMPWHCQQLLERLLLAAEDGTLEDGEAKAGLERLAHDLHEAWVEQEARR